MSRIVFEDQQNWLHSVEAARKQYELLPAEVRCNLNIIIDEIMFLKSSLLNLTLAAGSSDACRDCGGKCCNNGKFHVSLLDLMAYLRTSAELPVPDFENRPFCPYGCSDGCLMKPGFRSVTCVIFNCELVESLLMDSEQLKLKTLEVQLREKVIQAEQLLGFRVGRPLLLSFQ